MRHNVIVEFKTHEDAERYFKRISVHIKGIKSVQLDSKLESNVKEVGPPLSQEELKLFETLQKEENNLETQVQLAT